MTDHLFVYGTLMLRYPENPYRRLLTEHCSESFTGWCNGELYTLGEYPAMIPGTGIVYGEILCLQNSEELFKVLDAYEGYSPGSPRRSNYLRVKKNAFSNENYPYPCWVYLYNLPVKSLKKLDSGRFF